MRLGFTSQCEFTCDAASPCPDSVFFFQLKRTSRKPCQIPCAFSSTTRLAFDVTVNFFDSQLWPLPHSLFFSKKTRVVGILPHSSGSLSLCFLRYNASWVHKSVWIHMWCCQPLPGFRIFFQLKRTSRKPCQIPCAFSSTTRLAFDVTVNFFDSQLWPLPHSLFFSKKTRVVGILPHSSGSLSLCFLRYNTSWVHKSVWIHMWCCQPLLGVVSFSRGKRAPPELPGSFKAGTRAYTLTKEHCT